MSCKLLLYICLFIRVQCWAQIDIERIEGKWSFNAENDSTWISFKLNTEKSNHFPGTCDSTLIEYAGNYTANYHPFGTVTFSFFICEYSNEVIMLINNGCMFRKGEITFLSKDQLIINWTGKNETYYRIKQE